MRITYLGVSCAEPQPLELAVAQVVIGALGTRAKAKLKERCIYQHIPLVMGQFARPLTVYGT